MTDAQIEREVLTAIYGNYGAEAPKDQEESIKVYVHRPGDPPDKTTFVTMTFILSDGSTCFLSSRLPAMELGYDAFVWPAE